jgi:hypothetical protein
MVIIPVTRKRNMRGLKEPTTFGKTIQLSSEVKYLGLTLHKGLTLKKQLGKVMNTAYRAFWTCTGMSRGTRAKCAPMNIQHICKLPTAVTGWWLGIKFRTSRAELGKLLRLVCMGITGAMRAAPTVVTGLAVGG